MKRICVYCGSSPGTDPAYMDRARHVGEVLAARGLGLVYGGSNVGLMGEVANAVLKGQGTAIGVIPKFFASRMMQPERLTQLHVVNTMHERKTLMFELSDAFIALPGGLGTLEEIAEVLTWAQLGRHQKPCGFLNWNGYYDHLIAFLDNGVGHGFIKPKQRSMTLVGATVEDLLEQFTQYKAPDVFRWTDP